MKILHRSIDHRRTQWRPGLGACPCSVCHAEIVRRRGVGEDYSLGEPCEGCEYLNREAVFARLWENENRPGRVNRGNGILQDLMYRQKGGGPIDLALSSLRLAFRLTNRDRAIVATVVQWLGTNCGWCFLERCVRACGYRLVRDDEPLAVNRRLDS